MSHGFKQITPTDHFGWHAAYLPVYERLFAPFKPRGLSLLEIGTDGGGGLLMYADYFPHGTIYGVDIAPTPASLLGVARVGHFQRDAYTSEAVYAFAKMDIIIDDGPHSIESQEYFAANYSKALVREGIAIVEDVQDIGHFSRLAKALPLGFIGYGIDLRHDGDRYDNLLFVIERA